MDELDAVALGYQLFCKVKAEALLLIYQVSAFPVHEELGLPG